MIFRLFGEISIQLISTDHLTDIKSVLGNLNDIGGASKVVKLQIDSQLLDLSILYRFEKLGHEVSGHVWDVVGSKSEFIEGWDLLH